MRDCLHRALKRRVETGKPTKYLEVITDKLVQLAVAGEGWAIKEIFDRMDGRAVQPIAAKVDTDVLIRVQLIEASDGEPVLIDVTPSNGEIH